MNTALPRSITPDSNEPHDVLADFRELLSREPELGPEEIAETLDVAPWLVEVVLEVLRIEGEVLG